MISLKGIFQKTPQKFLAWLSYVSPVRWGFQGMMLTEFRPIADGEYNPRFFATNLTANETQYQWNAYTMLDNYNFCLNCTEFSPLFNNSHGSSTQNIPTPLYGYDVYKKFWTSIYYLLGIFVFFRVMTIVSLML